MKMKKLFVIEHDNGESYEDKKRTTIVLCSSRVKANRVVKEVNAWLAEKAAKAEKLAGPAHYSARREVFIDNLKPPYKAYCLIHALKYSEPLTVYISDERMPVV